MFRLARPSRPRLGQLSHARRQASSAQARIQELEPRRLFAIVTAVSADAFVDSIGINGHLGYDNANDHSYAYLHEVNGDHLLDVLGDTGIRHLRDYFGPKIAPGATEPFNARAEYLWDHYGIKVTLATGSKNPKNLDDIVYQLEQPWAEGVEGLNEPDGSLWTPAGDTQAESGVSPQTFAGTLNWQQTLWNTVNNDPNLSDISVLTTPFADSNWTGQLRDSGFDIANIHAYPKSNPGTWRLQSTYLPGAYNVDPSNPDLKVYITEQGYSTSNYADDSFGRPVSESAQRDYIPRVLTENFLAGVDRTYLYELIDGRQNLADEYEARLGLLRYDTTDKPAMTHLRNMISILEEGSFNPATDTWTKPSFTPGSLDYSLGGDTTNVHQLLMQKSNGEFYLALWQEVSNSSAGAYVNTTAKTISVNLNKSASAASLYTLDSASTPSLTFADTGSISFPVDSQVVILKITPTGYALPTNVNFTADFTTGGTTGWTPGSGDTWTVNTSGGNNFVQNTNASGMNLLSKPLGATANSLVVDFDAAWQFGGNSSVPYGNYSLTSGIDLLNSSNNGYRILLSQGNSNNAANDASITRIYKVTSGSVVGGPLASGPGYNKSGSSTPNWSHVRIARDATSGAISVYEDIDGDGEFTIVAKAVDSSYSSFSNLRLVVGNVNATEGARFDNVTAAVPTVTVATTDATAAEFGADAGFFVFSRNGAPNTLPLTINYVLGGSANPSADAGLGTTGTITILAGQNTATLPISPTNDGLAEGDEHLSIRILESAAYHVGQARSGEVRIIDEAADLVITNVTWSPSTVNAGSSVTFSVTVQNNGNTTVPAGVPVSIRFNNSGGDSIIKNTTAAIAPGGWTTVVMNPYTVSGSNRVVRAAVDSGHDSLTGAIPETNGANNTFYTFMPVINAAATDSFSGTLSSWTTSGDGWLIRSEAGQSFLENNTTAGGPTSRIITRALPSASTKSWLLDYKYTWRWGGTTAGNGQYSLGSYVDIVNAAGTGYRVKFHQGNSDNTANNSTLTQIFTMTTGTQGAQIASGTGFNTKGFKSLSLTAPNWRAVRIVFDRARSNLTVLADLDGTGRYQQIAVTGTLTPPSDFTQFSLGADGLQNTVSPVWDDVDFELLT